MTDIYDIIREYHGDKPYEPDSVKDDYKKFKDYTYDVNMSLKDINYLLNILDAYGNLANGAYCAKARFWKILLDSGVHLEVKEKPNKRMFARPPFGCVKNICKSDCETYKSKGCDICEFNCIEELELSGKSAYANPNFVGFDKEWKMTIYEVRWHGAGRTLMSRSYCKDRKSIQEYIDSIGNRIRLRNDWTIETKGNSLDYFETISRNDKSGMSIRKVNEVKKPYNMFEDEFKNLHFLFYCKFRAMLDDENLKNFIEQEEADIKNNCKLYSML